MVYNRVRCGLSAQTLNPKPFPVGWGWAYGRVLAGYCFSFFFLRNQWLSISILFEKNKEPWNYRFSYKCNNPNYQFAWFLKIIIITAGYVYVRVDFQIPSWESYQLFIGERDFFFKIIIFIFIWFPGFKFQWPEPRVSYKRWFAGYWD
jgi:hypothetical protein